MPERPQASGAAVLEPPAHPRDWTRGRLAFPDDAAAAHEARENAWSGLARAAGQALRFADSGSYDQLAAARAERLQALGELNRAPIK